MFKKLAIISFILNIFLGAFMFVYGEADDSPGGQLIGFLTVVVGVVGIIKSRRT